MNPRNQLSRSDRDPAALAVLALLTRGPRHPYDLHRFIVTTRKDFVTGLPRSLYHAVARLEGAGFIESAGTEQAEGRPERTRYALTEAGRAEARRRVTVLLSTPEPDATLMEAALSFMGILQRDEAITALRARAAALDVQRSRLTGDLAEATEVPPLLLVEADFELARLAAEHAWVTGLIDRLESGELAWLDDERP